jgi:hypothetical protein
METAQESAYFICESCRDPVDPADPNVVRAFEQQVIRTMGIGNQTIDGLPVLFHRECFSGGDSYRPDQDRSDLD